MKLFESLHRLVSCQFTGLGLVWFVLDEALERLGLATAGLRCYRLRNGAAVSLRPGTTDSKVFREVFAERIYAGPAAAIPQSSKPAVLVDLGANIGLSALFLHKQLGFEQIIAVEPDEGNLRMLHRNLTGNVSAHLTVHRAFAGAKRGFAQLIDAGFGAWGLRMGHAVEHGTPVMPLEDIVPDVPGGVLLKCDIEGGEREIFPQIRNWEDRVGYIILELHTEFFTFEALQAALEDSQYAWQIRGSVAPGAVLAVLSLERGQLKNAPRHDKQALDALTLQSGCDSRNHPRGAAAV